MPSEQKGERPPFDICERTFQFSLRIIKLCLALERQRPGIGWPLSKQLLKSGTSIGANIEEGQAAQSRADFIAKYSISRKEAREANYWLRLLCASEVLQHPDLTPLLGESVELIKILTAIIKNAENG